VIFMARQRRAWVSAAQGPAGAASGGNRSIRL